MNGKKLIIYIIIVALVAAGGFYLWSGQNNDQMVEDNEMTEDVKDMDGDEMDNDTMEDDKDMDSNMDKNDDDMTDEDKNDSSMDDKMMNEGDAAPGFTLMAVDGMEYTLSDYEGEKVLLKFWASWCSICLSELDEIDKVSASDEFKVLTIVSPGRGSEMDREDFIEWYMGLEMENMIVLLDDGGEIASEYLVRGYPTAAYVGSDGILVKTISGPTSAETIKDTFKGIY